MTDTAHKVRRTMHDFLTKEQWTSLKEHGYFVVTGSEGSIYKISTGYSGNIQVLKSEFLTTGITLCAHPRQVIDTGNTHNVAGYPLYLIECMVTQKLLLEHDEKRFIKIANIAAGRLPLLQRDSPW